MKKIILTLALGLWALEFAANAATLKVPTRTFTSEPTIRRRATLTLSETGPVTAPPWLLVGDSVAAMTDTNGVAWFTNVLAAKYRLDIAGTPGRSFPIAVFDTNGILDASVLVNSTNYNAAYYTAAQVDALIDQAVIEANALALTNNQSTATTFGANLFAPVVASTNFTGDGYGITNQQSMYSMFMNMPLGRPRSPGSYSEIASGQGNLTISAPGTEGVLWSLFFHLDVGSIGGLDTNVNEIQIVIRADGHDTVRVNASDFLMYCYRWPTQTNIVVRGNTDMLNWYAGGHPPETGLPLYYGTTYEPMAFTNGMTCYFTNVVRHYLWTNGYFQAKYNLLTLPPELKQARTYITNIHRVWANDASNFIFGISGAAEIIGWQIGLSNATTAGVAGFQADHGIAYYIDNVNYTIDLDDSVGGQTYGGFLGEGGDAISGYAHNDYDVFNDSVPGAAEFYKWLPGTKEVLSCTNSMRVYTDNSQPMDNAYFIYHYIRRP